MSKADKELSSMALPDPHLQWIQKNFEELRKYPDMFIALDPERGILVYAAE